MATKRQPRQGTVHFVGAGPGAPDLLTIRARNCIDRADCIIYAGSLVNPELFAATSVPRYDSSGMNLEQIVEIMQATVTAGGEVARVHTGDPSLYGAIREQMVRLEELGIPYQVIPGVSSAFAAAASLRSELTLPEVSQTVIFTRRAGRTPVPEKEALQALASHRATMVIFLSVGMIEAVAAELVSGGYPPETPTAVVARASWPDEAAYHGTLADIAETVRRAGVTKTALICVGSAFGDTNPPAVSKLYDRNFSHGTRRAGS